MKRETIRIWESSEYAYAGSFGFVPKIDAYCEECDLPRPAMVIVPGGGYRNITPIEGDLVAKRFLQLGYQAFVCTYSINPLLCFPLRDQPMDDLARAIRLIRENAAHFFLDPTRVYVCGFSSGAHLVGSVLTRGDAIRDQNRKYARQSCLPTAAILSYPVTTSAAGAAHAGTFEALLGRDADRQEWEIYDNVGKVTANTPPTFIWHTVNDAIVHVQNSLLLAEAYRKQNVPFALHLFSDGVHGLSLADETVVLTEQSTYTLEQLHKIREAVNRGLVTPSPEGADFLDLALSCRYIKPDLVKPEATAWVSMAHTWLRSL